MVFVKNDPVKKWYTQSICTLLYINFDGLYISSWTVRNRSLCTNIIICAIIMYEDQIARISFVMAPKRGWYHHQGRGEDERGSPRLFITHTTKTNPDIQMADIRQTLAIRRILLFRICSGFSTQLPRWSSSDLVLHFQTSSFLFCKKIKEKW